MNIESGDRITDGAILTIKVSSLDGEYWSSVDMELPEDEDFDIVQFEVILYGIELAKEKIDSILYNLRGDNDI